MTAQTQSNNNLNKLRQELIAHKLDGYIIPSCDEFQNEYVPNHLRRLEWLSGFTGSNGVAIVSQNRAVLYTDGRYLLQAQQQLASDWEVRDIGQPGDCIWFSLDQGSCFGYDPMLHTKVNLEYYRSLAHKYNFTMQASSQNLVDQVWSRSPSKVQPIMLLPIEYSGKEYQEKIKDIIAAMGADYLLITAPDAVSWLLNIRGYTVEHTPVVLAMALLSRNGEVSLFGEPGPSNIEHYPLAQLSKNLEMLKTSGKIIQYDPKQAPVELAALCQLAASDPCSLAKAIKNQVEQDGMRQAAIIDSIALCRFLHWLDTSDEDKDEISTAAKLLEFRQEHPLFQMPSFATISAFAANGAVIHYHPSAKTNIKLQGNGLYLVDSGGHYMCGTTDVTRVIPIGKPTAQQQLYYTLVLKGHIALARAAFPYKTNGGQLDALARMPLWQHGADYEHGTGHGVGHFLSVHEGPQRIGKSNANYPLAPGMVVSNEPGYYKAGEYGIRLENLMLITESKKSRFLKFETLTLVPFASRLIEYSMLTAKEKEWLDNYHSRICEVIGPQLPFECRQWLKSIIHTVIA